MLLIHSLITTTKNELNPTIYSVFMEKDQDNKLLFFDLLRSYDSGHLCIVSPPSPDSTSISTPIIHIIWRKKIVSCLQHRAKAICSNTDAYQEEMISLRHSLHRNNYTERITWATRNFDRRIEDDTRKLTTLCLPYVKGLAERIQKICSAYDIKTIFTNGSTFRRYLFCIKPPTEFNMMDNWVYSIPCSVVKYTKARHAAHQT